MLTNANLTGTHLASQVAPYALVPLPGGRRLAYLQLLDATNLLAVQPALALRMTDFHYATRVALAQLQRLPGGRPDVVVLSLDANGDDVCVRRAADAPPLDVTRPWARLDRRHCTTTLAAQLGSRAAAATAKLESLVTEVDGVDIALVASSRFDRIMSKEPYTIRNLAGDAVLIVPATRRPKIMLLRG